MSEWIGKHRGQRGSDGRGLKRSETRTCGNVFYVSGSEMIDLGRT